MKKESLKRLKAGLLALSLCTTMSGYSLDESSNTQVVYDNTTEIQNNNTQSVLDNTTDTQKIQKETTCVTFIEGKALINSLDGESYIDEYGYKNAVGFYKDKEFVEFHYAVTIKVGSLEEAILLATAIVGEENIVYYDLNSNGMQLSYSKKER